MLRLFCRAKSSASRAIFKTSVSPLRTKTGMSICRPSVSNCSMAAGRYTSAATSNGVRACLCNSRASLPLEVVLPDPCNPTIRMQLGFPLRASPALVEPSSLTSSS